MQGKCAFSKFARSYFPWSYLPPPWNPCKTHYAGTRSLGKIQKEEAGRSSFSHGRQEVSVGVGWGLEPALRPELPAWCIYLHQTHFLSSKVLFPSHSSAVEPCEASLERSRDFRHDKFAICPVFLLGNSLCKSAAINIVTEGDKCLMDGAITDQQEKSYSRTE